MSGHWEIDEGHVDSAEFFGALFDLCPEATTLYAEGCAMADDVMDCYLLHAQPGEFLPGANTIWPISKKFRCQFDSKLLGDLVALSNRHAEPELLDHLFIYAGAEPLLQWHDAFGNAMLLSNSLPEARIASFANRLHLPYAKASYG